MKACDIFSNCQEVSINKMLSQKSTLQIQVSAKLQNTILRNCYRGWIKVVLENLSRTELGSSKNAQKAKIINPLMCSWFHKPWMNI